MLRCSILINVAVLLYICSHAVNFDDNLQIVPSPPYLVQNSAAASAQAAPIVARQNEASAAVARKELGISSNNENFFSNKEKVEEIQVRDKAN